MPDVPPVTIAVEARVAHRGPRGVVLRAADGHTIYAVGASELAGVPLGATVTVGLFDLHPAGTA